jgi:hypothetical protein
VNWAVGEVALKEIGACERTDKDEFGVFGFD